MNRIRTIVSLAAVAGLLGLAGGVAWGQAAKWDAPAAEKAKKNPVAFAKESIAAGEKIAKTNCAPCHGDKGKGDGPGAAALPKKPADWTSKMVQAETDGALFWKISKGNPPMPPWESLPEKDRWNLVNYIRSVGGKK